MKTLIHPSRGENKFLRSTPVRYEAQIEARKERVKRKNLKTKQQRGGAYFLIQGQRTLQRKLVSYEGDVMAGYGRPPGCDFPGVWRHRVLAVMRDKS